MADFFIFTTVLAMEGDILFGAVRSASQLARNERRTKRCTRVIYLVDIVSVEQTRGGSGLGQIVSSSSSRVCNRLCEKFHTGLGIYIKMRWERQDRSTTTWGKKIAS